MLWCGWPFSLYSGHSSAICAMVRMQCSMLRMAVFHGLDRHFHLKIILKVSCALRCGCRVLRCGVVHFFHWSVLRIFQKCHVFFSGFPFSYFHIVFMFSFYIFLEACHLCYGADGLVLHGADGIFSVNWPDKESVICGADAIFYGAAVFFALCCGKFYGTESSFNAT